MLLAAQYMQGRNADHAEAAYLAALQIAPGLDITRFQLGLLQLTGGRPATAAITWAPLNLLGNTHPLRLFKLAFNHLQQDEIDAACRHLREGMKYNVDNAPLNRDMQVLLEKLEASQQRRPAGQTPETSASAAAPTAEPGTGTHFLLATYQSLH